MSFIDTYLLAKIAANTQPRMRYGGIVTITGLLLGCSIWVFVAGANFIGFAMIGGCILLMILRSVWISQEDHPRTRDPVMGGDIVIAILMALFMLGLFVVLLQPSLIH